MTTNITNFTPGEWAIIDHRLGASDAIIECFQDCEDPAWSVQEIADRIEQIERSGGRNIDTSDPLTCAIIRDCLDGSTFFANIEDAIFDGCINRGEALAAHRAANRLDARWNTTTPRD